MAETNLIPDEEIFDKEIYQALGVASYETTREEFRTRKPVEKKKRFADAPHLITIIFSLAALVVSTLSWRESQHSRLINQSSNRALAYVIDVQQMPKSFYVEEVKYRGNKNGVLMKFKIVVKNIGRTTAKLVRCWYSLDSNSGCSDGSTIAMLEDKIKKSPIIWNELSPGIQEEIIIPVDLIYSHENLYEEYYLVGRLIYQDELTERTYEHEWCFQLGGGSANNPIVPCQTNYPESKPEP